MSVKKAKKPAVKKTKKPAVKKTKKRVARRRRMANPALPAHADVAVSAGVALASYATTRVAGRVAFVIAERRAPRLSKHAHVIGSLVAASAIYVGTRNIARMKPHHQAAVAGTVVAAIHALLTAYLPQFAWLLSDPRATEYKDNIRIADSDGSRSDFEFVDIEDAPATSADIASEPPSSSDDSEYGQLFTFPSQPITEEIG